MLNLNKDDEFHPENLIVIPLENDNIKSDGETAFIIKWDTVQNLPSFKLVEPFSWSWAAIKICEGVLVNLGAKIFEEIFFGRQALDFKRIIYDAINVFCDLLHETLEASDRRKLEVQISAIEQLFRFYLNSPNSYQLDQLQFEIIKAIEEADSLGLKALGSFGISGSLGLAVLKEKFNISSSSGDQKNVVLLADSLLQRVPLMRERLEQWNNNRFSDVFRHRYEIGGPGPVHSSAFGFYYKLDGRVVEVVFDKKKAENMRNQHLAREWRAKEKDMLAPLYAIGVKWSEIKAIHDA